MCRAAEITRAQPKSCIEMMLQCMQVKREEQHTNNQQNKTAENENPQKLSAADVEGHTYHDLCPAYGKICNSCGKNNHFAKCCKADFAKKKVHTV